MPVFICEDCFGGPHGEVLTLGFPSPFQCDACMAVKESTEYVYADAILDVETRARAESHHLPLKRGREAARLIPPLGGARHGPP